jgi:hypothetical protein
VITVIELVFISNYVIETDGFAATGISAEFIARFLVGIVGYVSDAGSETA